MPDPRNARTDWTAPDSPRIFRSPAFDFYRDEALQAEGVLTAEEMARIAAHGFNGLWLRGRLRGLMASTVLPELNDPERPRRIAGLRAAIDRARDAGMGLYLFFNDPLALAEDDPFWLHRPELRGEPHVGWRGERVCSLCLSHPAVAAFMDEACASVLRDLPGLAGLILITASEHHSHCWSHYARFGLDDGFVFPATEPMACPRCRGREPAELVGQIAGAWRNAADAHNPACRVIAWNWSWSIWYRDPQAEVLRALPPGVDVLADWERGGQRPWRGRTVRVDEYSLGYAGPSERFATTQRAAEGAGRRVLAKLQIGTTHEVGTTPSLPLLTRLHAKLAGLTARGVGGFMGSWNFGCGLTLNTHAVGHFLKDPHRFMDAEPFLRSLAADYFGAAEAAPLVEAWRGFAEAFDHYPFHIRFLYFSPLNDAPAHPLSLRYEGKPLGGSWVAHELGDRLEDCLGPFTLAEVADAFEALDARWRAALAPYRAALAQPPPAATPEQRLHMQEELATAEMLAVQFRSTRNLFRFHQERATLMAAHGLTPPCELPRTPALAALMAEEIRNCESALPWVDRDPRLGYHQEGRVHMYNAASIRRKIDLMRAEIA
jgi:hypothetical protein